MATDGTTLVAIVGIIGTLAGVVVGALVTLKIQKMQIEHSDATRFQEHRLDSYVQYTTSANFALAQWRTGKYNEELVANFLRLHEKVRLVGTEEVVEQANLLHEIFTKIHGLTDKTQVPENYLDEFTRAITGFITAARNELRIKQTST